MTYKELVDKILAMPENQQKLPVTVVNDPGTDDEDFLSVIEVKTFPKGTNPNQPYLLVD